MSVELTENEKLQKMMRQVYKAYESGQDQLTPSELANLTRSFALLSLARSQLNRPTAVVGQQPFASASIFGEGHGGHPHY